MLTGGRTDRRTDMTQLTICIRNFANAPKNKITGFTDRHRDVRMQQTRHQRATRRGYVWLVQFPVYFERVWHYVWKLQIWRIWKEITGNACY